MLFKSLEFIKILLSESKNDKDGSIAVTDPILLQKFIDDSEFPFLVSFPRTGSHWLRMIMELYFERPSLVRVFYYKDRKDYITLHTHDMELDVYRKNIIYLYRNPVPTVYSQIMYDGEDINNPERVKYWANYYGRHLCKWLVGENLSEKKTIVRYENMIKDMAGEFAKITAHFGKTLDIAKLNAAAERVSKKEVKNKTTHDQKVVNFDSNYKNIREKFAKEFSSLIEDLIFKETAELSSFFR